MHGPFRLAHLTAVQMAERAYLLVQVGMEAVLQRAEEKVAFLQSQAVESLLVLGPGLVRQDPRAVAEMAASQMVGEKAAFH